MYKTFNNAKSFRYVAISIILQLSGNTVPKKLRFKLFPYFLYEYIEISLECQDLCEFQHYFMTPAQVFASVWQRPRARDKCAKHMSHKNTL